jgi:hypothetical protein
MNPRMAGLRTTTGPLLKSRRLVVAKALDVQADETGLAPQDLNASNDD